MKALFRTAAAAALALATSAVLARRGDQEGVTDVTRNRKRVVIPDLIRNPARLSGSQPSLG
jgi:hypothetical protein